MNLVFHTDAQRTPTISYVSPNKSTTRWNDDGRDCNDGEEDYDDYYSDYEDGDNNHDYVGDEFFVILYSVFL